MIMKVSEEVAHGYSIEAARKERIAETSTQWLAAAQAWFNMAQSAPRESQTEYALRRYCFCVKKLQRMNAHDALCILGEL